MLVAAPEFKCGAVGEDAGAEKPSSVPEPLASLRGTLRLGSGQACEAAVATRASVMPATSCRASLGPTEFQRGGEMGAYAGGFFGGGDHPLIKGAADAAALGGVFDDDEAHEVATGGQ